MSSSPTAPMGTSLSGLLLWATQRTPPSAVPMLVATSPTPMTQQEPRAVVSAGPYEFTSWTLAAQLVTMSLFSGSPPQSRTLTDGKSSGRSSCTTVGVRTSWVTPMRRAAPLMSLTRSDSVGTQTQLQNCRARVSGPASSDGPYASTFVHQASCGQMMPLGTPVLPELKMT